MRLRSLKFAIFCLGALSALSGTTLAQDEDIPPQTDIDGAAKTAVDAATQDAAALETTTAEGGDKKATATAAQDETQQQTVTTTSVDDQTGEQVQTTTTTTTVTTKKVREATYEAPVDQSQVDADQDQTETGEDGEPLAQDGQTTTAGDQTKKETTATTSSVTANMENVKAKEQSTGLQTATMSAEGTKMEQKPDLQLLTPMQRKDFNPSTLSKAPCGGSKIGHVHYETTPGSRNLVGWKVKKDSPTGTCFLRVADDPNDKTWDVVELTDDSQAEDGSFPCGRNETPFEAREFKTPKDLICDTCILQLEWRTEFGKQFYCADFESIGTEIPECFGQCLNGGICKNGLCACPKEFEGNNCQFEREPQEVESTSVISILMEDGSILLFYLLIILLIIGLLLGAYLLTQRARDIMADRARRQADEEAQKLVDQQRQNDDAITDKKSGKPQQESQFNR